MKTKTFTTYVALATLLVCGALALVTSAHAAKQAVTGKYIITELPETNLDKAGNSAAASTLGNAKDVSKMVLTLNGKLIKGANDFDVAWITKADPDHVWVKQHSHPYPETLGFFGSDPAHPADLNAVIEIWINGEKHVLTKSSLIYVPANVVHCPLIIKKLDKPVLFVTTVGNTSYVVNKKSD